VERQLVAVLLIADSLGAMKRSYRRTFHCLAVVLCALSFAAQGQSGDVDTAQELTHPLADLLTLPSCCLCELAV